MKTKLLTIITLCFFFQLLSAGTKEKPIELKSPNGNIQLNVVTGKQIQWSVQYKGQQIISPSAVSLQLDNGEVLGGAVAVKSSEKKTIDTQFNAINYRRSVIKDQYSLLNLQFKNDFSIQFRVYNDAVAYRFITSKKEELLVKNEEANFNFTADHKIFAPMQWDYRDGKIFNSSFEALYKETNLSRFPKDSLAFLPVLVDLGNDLKAVILEADLEDYPGMYLNLNTTGQGFQGVYAPYPIETYQKGINVIASKRAPYIAKVAGARSFPWRVVAIAAHDKDLLNCDIIQKLASPNRLNDISWVKPGLVAWDWWNDTNISHVDFKSGMNTQTFKYYIDFASINKVPYIIMDGGWSNEKDLTVAVPDIDLKAIVDYGKSKNVGVIVWASWHAVMEQMDKVFPYLSKVGVKGLKIDFFDRDDQLAVASTYTIAKLAADYKLMVDYHGIYKPTGLQRTYPNVVGYEGVKGLENYKWANEDQPRYCVSIPFIRNMAGPMDYTPGSMRNATKETYFANNSMPMSKGTRCNQMAMYVVFEAPLQMLSDNPTTYLKEKECTDFIVKMPTVFDETVPLDGKVGEYVAVARKKDNVCYAAAMTNWTPRELILDFSFLGEGTYQAEVFRDGINADRDATDYKKETLNIKAGDKIKIQLANGGGWAARIVKQ